MFVPISALATLADPLAGGVSGNDTLYLWIAIATGFLALAAALLFARSVLASPRHQSDPRPDRYPYRRARQRDFNRAVR